MVQNRKRGDRWELPGGRAAPGESPEACAEREFLEETGRALEDSRLVHRRQGALGEGHVFLGRAGERRGAPIEAEIRATRFFADLPDRALLSFPDDPYPELFDAVRRALTPAKAPREAGPADP